MKKKILSIALVVAMLAIAVVGGTLSYLTDDDYALNTMVVGNFTITQNEENADGTDFTQDQTLIPAVYDYEKINDNWYEPVDPNNVENTIGKVISVTNNSNTVSIYARTIVAFEHTDLNDDGDFSDGIACKVHRIYNNEGVAYEVYADQILDDIEIDGKIYSLATFTYTDPIAAGATSPESLKSVFFDLSTTQEDLAKVGERYEILALSQAVQADGFGSAEEALDTAFGDITDANADAIVSWFETAIEQAEDAQA